MDKGECLARWVAVERVRIARINAEYAREIRRTDADPRAAEAAQAHARSVNTRAAWQQIGKVRDRLRRQRAWRAPDMRRLVPPWEGRRNTRGYRMTAESRDPRILNSRPQDPL